MAAHVVDLRRHWRIAQQKVHELGSQKLERGIKMSRRGIKLEPVCGINPAENDVTGPWTDTVRAQNGVVAVLI